MYIANIKMYVLFLCLLTELDAASFVKLSKKEAAIIEAKLDLNGEEKNERFTLHT